MSKLRIAYFLGTDANGALPSNPVDSLTIDVTTSALASGQQPVVPALGASARPLAVQLTAIGVPMYLAVGKTPDPTIEPRQFLPADKPTLLSIVAGDRISPIIAADIAGGLTYTSQQVIVPQAQATQILPANPARRFLEVRNSGGGGSAPGVQLTFGGPVPFDSGNHPLPMFTGDITMHGSEISTQALWGWVPTPVNYGYGITTNPGVLMIREGV